MLPPCQHARTGEHSFQPSGLAQWQSHPANSATRHSNRCSPAYQSPTFQVPLSCSYSTASAPSPNSRAWVAWLPRPAAPGDLPGKVCWWAPPLGWGLPLLAPPRNRPPGLATCPRFPPDRPGPNPGGASNAVEQWGGGGGVPPKAAPPLRRPRPPRPAPPGGARPRPCMGSAAVVLIKRIY